MTPEQQKIVEENHSLIYAFLARYHFPMDYYGDAAIGLCEAAIKFDPTFGTKFSTYAYKSMYTHCLRAKKINDKHIGTISLNAPLTTEDNFTLEDTIKDVNADKNLESQSYVFWFLEVLPLFDLQILVRKLKGMTLREIGADLGCSGQNILNHINVMKDALQKNKKNRRWDVSASEERDEIISEITSLLH